MVQLGRLPRSDQSGLSAVESMQIGQNFLSLCADLGLEQILDETIPPGLTIEAHEDVVIQSEGGRPS